MVRTPFSSVQAGQAIDLSASEHNAFIRVAKKNEPGLGNLANWANQITRVRLVNNLALEVVAGSIVRLTAEVRDTTLPDPVNTGNILLRGAFEFERAENIDPLNSVYAIVDTTLGAKPTIGPAEIGYGTVSQIGVANVNILDLDHKYAEPKWDGTFGMNSTTDPMSPYILTGTHDAIGERSCNVWQRGISTVIRKGVVTQAGGIPFDDLGTVTIYLYSLPEKMADGVTNHTVVAWNDWIDGGDIGEGIRVFVAYFPDEDVWRIIEAECEPEAVGAPPGDGDSITASATQTRGEGPLSYRVNRVTTIATDNDVVTLPSTFSQGDDCFIQNADSTGSNTLQIFPSGASDTINGGSPGASETLAFDLSVRYFLVRTGHWVS